MRLGVYYTAMIRKELQGTVLTLEEALKLPSESERLFAVRCILVGCILEHQVPVGSSVIDFLVRNPKRIDSDGKLVEVTLLDRVQQGGSSGKSRRNRRKAQRNRRKNSGTVERKQRQIVAMQASGLPWTILYNEHIISLKKPAEQGSL